MPNSVGSDMLHIASSDLSTEMGIPGQYKHARMRQTYEVTARAARAHGESIGVGGVRENLEFQTWLLQLGMRYLTAGSDVGISSAPAAPMWSGCARCRLPRMP